MKEEDEGNHMFGVEVQGSEEGATARNVAQENTSTGNGSTGNLRTGAWTMITIMLLRERWPGHRSGEWTSGAGVTDNEWRGPGDLPQECSVGLRRSGANEGANIVGMTCSSCAGRGGTSRTDHLSGDGQGKRFLIGRWRTDQGEFTA